ncbi:MAG TPA: hypothetical protein VF787_18805 [Thermoanaerobaculia bacterium]
MRKTTALLFLCLVFAAGAAHANHYADTYVIPIVGHTVGANGTTWMSDVAIRNFRTTPLDVQLIVIESGFNTSDNVYPLTTGTNAGVITIGANSTVMLKDVLAGHRGLQNVTGALILGASAPFAVTSRTYSNNMAVGQTVNPERDFLDNSLENADNTSTAYVPGIISNTAARTNVGFTAGAGPGAPMTVEVTIRNASGGSLGIRSITVPAGNFMQIQFPVGSLTNTTFDNGSADFRIVSGEGVVVPYASIVDNASGNAAYVTGVFPETTSAAAASLFNRSYIFRNLFDRTYR